MGDWLAALHGIRWGEHSLGYQPAVDVPDLLPRVVAGDKEAVSKLCALMRRALELESSSAPIATVLTTALYDLSTSPRVFEPLLQIASELASATSRAWEPPHSNPRFAALIEDCRRSLAAGADALGLWLSRTEMRPTVMAILGACGPHPRPVIDQMAAAAAAAPADEQGSLWLAVALACEQGDDELRGHAASRIPSSDDPALTLARGLVIHDLSCDALHRVCLHPERVVLAPPALNADLCFVAASALAARTRHRREHAFLDWTRQTLERRIAIAGSNPAEDIVVACLSSALQDVHLERFAGRMDDSVTADELAPHEREFVGWLGRHRLRIAPHFGFPTSPDAERFLTANGLLDRKLLFQGAALPLWKAVNQVKRDDAALRILPATIHRVFPREEWVPVCREIASNAYARPNDHFHESSAVQLVLDILAPLSSTHREALTALGAELRQEGASVLSKSIGAALTQRFG